MTETFTAHRRLLFALAYRMLGRVAEAEDIVQETWLRWQRQAPGAVESPKAWLVTTATRLCLDQLRSARRQREEYYGVWLPEPVVQAPERAPDESAALADSLTMAFMLMLECLSPAERAVFLLREVFDHDYAAIARIVGKSEAACRQIVSRAKSRVAGEAAPAVTPTPRARQLVERFLAATTTGQVGDLVAMLTDDAILYSDGGGLVPAAGRPIRTADHIGRFFVGVRSRYTGEVILRMMQVNGRPGALMWSDGRLVNAYAFDVAGDRIRAIYVVRNPDKLRHLAGSARGGDPRARA